MSAPLRMVFLGSDAIALPLLEWLAGAGAALARVVLVLTQPDRAVGRGQRVQPNAIKIWAESHGVPVLQPGKVTDEVRAQVAAFAPDVALVMAYGHLLRDDFIATPRLGTLNLHTSILPRYRGASPIQTAIATGERETGVTLMRIVRRMDAGPVADGERIAVGPLDTAAAVEARLATGCVRLLERTLPALGAGTLRFTAQDEAGASYCRKLTKEDGWLDFSAPAAVLAARINGLYPWPGCVAEIAGVPIKLGLADVAGHDPLPPGGPWAAGRVGGCDTAGLLVGTGAGVLRVHCLQRPGGRMLSAGEFLRGYPVPPGTLLASRPMSSLLVTR